MKMNEVIKNFIIFQKKSKCLPLRSDRRGNKIKKIELNVTKKIKVVISYLGMIHCQLWN